MEMSAQHVAALMPVAARPPFVLVRGEGAYVIDNAGGVISIGYKAGQ
ncbi:hypothetical protein [uncultured Propionivibrio sp.]|nr:hypothetical protein [uncultured Propionivibrio sp.]